jgi:hypothetical protein
VQIVVTRKRGNAVTRIRWQSMIRISFAIFLSEYRKTLSASAFYYYRLRFLLLIKVSIFAKYEHICPLFYPIYHYLSLFVTICHSVLHVLHFIFTIYILWTNFLCKNLIYHLFIYNILCSINYLMISILSASLIVCY